MDIRQFLQGIVPRATSPLHRAGIEPGLYHYLREAAGTFVRYHLRVDSTGNGLLLANAAAAAQLRPSGVIIAKGLLEGDDEATILRRLRASFRGVALQQAAADIAQVRAILAALDSPGDNYPIVNLADPSFSPHATPLDKPLSADVPLAGPHFLAPILDRLWDLGVPHVTIIAGKAPEAAALVRAVERAGDLGLIAGVRGFGSDLARGTLIADLAAAGLDHLDVYFLSAVDTVHDALAQAGDYQDAVRAFGLGRKHEVCPVGLTALVRPTMATLEATLDALAAHGAGSAGFFPVATTSREEAALGPLHADELVQAARAVEEAAEHYGMRLLWYPAVRFDPARTLAEQVCSGPRCGGDTAVRVEPDGTVLVARGPCLPAGNLLTDCWETIRQSEVFRNYRQRVEGDTHCDQCPGLAICAADCPKNPLGWTSGTDQGAGMRDEG